MVKNPVANAGEARDVGSIPGSGRSPGGGHGNPYSCPSGEFHGQRSLVGFSPWDHKELDTTKQLTLSLFHPCSMKGNIAITKFYYYFPIYII